MRVVLDANVFVSAALEPLGHPARIVRAWRDGVIDLVSSQAIIDEIAEVLRRPRIRGRHQWTDEQIDSLMETMRTLAVLTPGLLHVRAVDADPDDDMYLACALEGEAEYIVSGDDHLIGLADYYGVRIVSPMQFAALLDTV